MVEGGGGAGSRLPAALKAPREEPDGAPEPKWIGAGSFGAVYEAEHAGQKVAVKKFFESTASSSGFQREAALLADLRHAHVVQLIKVGTRPQLCIVTELLPCSLHALLHHGGAHPRRESLLGRQAVGTLCTHIACGMNYLHTYDPPVLHRNLKSQNLLLDEAGRVKISDFGWSRFKALDSCKTFIPSWQFVAPEILAGEPFSQAADVFSFAMIGWEVLTRSLPFVGMNPVQIAQAVQQQKLRPEVPADSPPDFAALLGECWHDESGRRPSFTKVLGRLQAQVALGTWREIT